MLKIGMKAIITSDNENYFEFMDQALKIESIAYNMLDHPGYDESMEGMALVDFEDVPFSLYEYEFTLIEEE